MYLYVFSRGILKRVPLTRMTNQTYQLCLPLTDVPYVFNAKGSPRPIPPLVKELFEVCDESPTGLVWKVASKNGRAKVGKPAGSKSGANCYVSVRGHGVFYAHRVVYYLKYGQDPGSMVVRHTNTDDLILGWQDDNGRDEKGVTRIKKERKPTAPTWLKNEMSKKLKEKEVVVGQVTKIMYRYDNALYNAKSLCKKLGLNYSTIYQRMHRCNQLGVHAFAIEGVEVEQINLW